MDKATEKMMKGERARGLLNDPAFREFIEGNKDRILLEFFDTEPKDEHRIKDLHSEGRALKRLLDSLNVAAAIGQAESEKARKKRESEEKQSNRRGRL